MDKYLNYAKHIGCQADVSDWINVHLKAHLDKNAEIQTEIEHIIDYLASDKRPKRLSKMSYKQAAANTKKWNDALVKKGAKINESPDDVTVIKDYGDGFRIVQLVGKAAFEREGYLMRHCVASYFGRDTKVYSLRDKDNMPHCTIEWGNQIKGKGNGSIHPKYVDYIVKFLEETGMTVNDNEMQNLGYANIEKIIKKIDVKKSAIYAQKYWHMDSALIAKNGEEYAELDLWDYKPLIVEVAGSVKINFDLSAFLKKALNKLGKKKFAGDSNQTVVTGYRNRTGVTGYRNRTGVTGDSNQTGVAGYSNQTGVTGYRNRTGVTGDSNQTGVAGDSNQTVVTGYSSQTGVTGDWNQTGVTGGRNRTGVTGDWNRTGVTGDWNQTGVTGDSNQTVVTGYSNRTGVTGDSNQTGVTGDSNQTVVTGDWNSLEMSGKSSIGMMAGIGNKGKIGELGCLVLSRWDDKEKRYRVSVGYEGENIKAGIWYKLDDAGNFVEVEN